MADRTTTLVLGGGLLCGVVIGWWSSRADFSDPLGVIVYCLVAFGAILLWRRAGFGLAESASWVLPLTGWNLAMWLVIPNPLATIGLAIGVAVMVAMLGSPTAAPWWLRLIGRRND